MELIVLQFQYKQSKVIPKDRQLAVSYACSLFVPTLLIHQYCMQKGEQESCLLKSWH